MDLFGCRPGVRSAATDFGDAARDLGRALRGLLHIASDFIRGGALFLHGRRNGRRDLRYLRDGGPDILDCGNRLLRRGLHLRNLRGDFFGRLGGLGRKRLHFRCDHRKAFAGFAGAGSFDRRVQGKKVGLLGHSGDHFDDLANAVRRLQQLGNPLIGLVRLVHRGMGDLVRFLNLPPDFGYRHGHLLRGRGSRLHVRG